MGLEWTLYAVSVVALISLGFLDRHLRRKFDQERREADRIYCNALFRIVEDADQAEAPE